MKNLCSTTLLVTLAVCGPATLYGQETDFPKPGPEFDIFKSEVGTWDVETKFWTGPGEPAVSKGKEITRMLGGYWSLVDFESNMMGMNFKGHGIYSYDTKKKQYFGTWIDSMSPKKMEVIGHYDKATRSLTYEGIAPAPDGKDARHVMKTTYKDDGTRVMTMHVETAGAMVKIFEMNYSKAKAAHGPAVKSER